MKPVNEYELASNPGERLTINGDTGDAPKKINFVGDIVTETQTCCLAWALIPNHAQISLIVEHVEICWK